MELVWGSKDFVIAGQPYQGFPILLWDSMESCTQANLFFRHYLLRGEIGSKESWPNTGRALYDFFSFLQAHDLDWRDVDRGEAKSLVAAYRDYCLVTCGLARNTTRQRLTYICKFYEFALGKGWVRRLPFGHEERIVPRETGFLEHVDASGGKASPLHPEPKCRYRHQSEGSSVSVLQPCELHLREQLWKDKCSMRANAAPYMASTKVLGHPNPASAMAQCHVASGSLISHLKRQTRGCHDPLGHRPRGSDDLSNTWEG